MKVVELIETIARERCVEKSLVMSIMSDILLDFAKSKYGEYDNMCSSLNEDGSFEIYLNKEVVESCESSFYQIDFNKAQQVKQNVQLGDVVKEIVPFLLGQSDIKKIYHLFKKKLIEVQKEREYEVFKEKIGTNVTGYIKRIEVADAVISFQEGEGILRKSEMLQNDVLHPGMYIKVHVKDVRSGYGRQIILSRTCDGFLKELLKQEVPEIQDGIIEIKAVARDAGSLSKVAVTSNRESINPVSVCIGVYGNRVQAVSKELLGEKVSIIEWDSDTLKFIAAALSPAEILKVEDLSNDRYNVVTLQEQFSRAMGRGGQNVLLARRLCGVVSIKLLTKEEDLKLSQETLNAKVADLVHWLDIEDMMARLLISEGFDTVPKISNSEISALAALNGFDEELASILKDRAKEADVVYKDQLKKILIEKEKDLSLFDLDITNDYIKCLINNGIYTSSSLAMLDGGELEDLFVNGGLNVGFDEACRVIMKARNIKERSNG